MTPKKSIVRTPTYTLPDGSAIPSMGREFTTKESAFIFWYTYPETEAFLNGGRACIRAGYKPENAVKQAYLLKRKPRIVEKMDSILQLVNFQIYDTFYMAIDLVSIRCFFDISDFYRDCKRIVKRNGYEIEIDSYEVVPLSELSWEQRMCIDGITYKGPYNDPFYKLPNRDKMLDLLLKLHKMQNPENGGSEPDYKEMAEILLTGVLPPVITTQTGYPPKDAIEAL